VILAAAGKPAYSKLIDEAVVAAKKTGGSLDEQTENAMDAVVS
jgi:transaldolase